MSRARDRIRRKLAQAPDNALYLRSELKTLLGSKDGKQTLAPHRDRVVAFATDLAKLGAEAAYAKHGVDPKVRSGPT